MTNELEELMSIGEVFASLIFISSPIFLFEYLRDKYMTKHYKKLIPLVHKRKEYDFYSRRYVRIANLFRLPGIIWAIGWSYALFFT